MQKILADDTCVCIATAVDFSIQVQMNQWKIVWLPVWMNLMLLLEVVLSLVRVHATVHFRFKILYQVQVPKGVFSSTKLFRDRNKYNVHVRL